MKEEQFDVAIVAARPEDYGNDVQFTNAVMAAISANEIMISFVRKTNGTKKETLFMKLRHLPKFAIVILAICALFITAGTTYAVVETVKKLNVKVNSSGENEFGREQLQVSFDSCEEERKRGTTYELKQDSGLSAEDGAKVLQARCEIDTISSWVENDEQSKQLLNNGPYSIPGRVMSFFPESVRRVEAISDVSIKFERDEAPFPASSRVVVDNQVVGRDTLKVGDSVFYFNPSFRVGRGATPATAPAEGVVIFKLALEKQFYGLDFQSYVRTRTACRENPMLTCLKASNINHVILIVARGGYTPSLSDHAPQRELQGRVVSYTDTSIVLDAGGGKLYTIHTPRNVIHTYNTATVYGLATFDTIYSKTDPEELKIRTGDILGIVYSEQAGVYSTDIPWEKLGGIDLMVERTVKDIGVLRKY